LYFLQIADKVPAFDSAFAWNLLSRIDLPPIRIFIFKSPSM